MKPSSPAQHPILEAIAAGDALGLPYEGTQPKSVEWGFIGDWGVTSDDTQQALIAWRALQESQMKPAKFRGLLAEYIAQWFCCLSPSMGLGTLKSSLKLCAGLESPQSGSSSEGNGPLPRAAILGWELAGNPQLGEFIRISTTTTHNSAKAGYASLTLGRTMEAIKINPQVTQEELYAIWGTSDSSPEWQKYLCSLKKSKSIKELQLATGQVKRTSGHAQLTLIVALWAFLHYRQDMKSALPTVVRAGGDTDSAAAITSALCAAAGGKPSTEWRKIADWPVNREPSLKRIGFNLATLGLIMFYHLPKLILGI